MVLRQFITVNWAGSIQFSGVRIHRESLHKTETDIK